MEKSEGDKRNKEKDGDCLSPSAKENSAVDALAASSVRSNLDRIFAAKSSEQKLADQFSGNKTSESTAHWLSPLAFICSCCSATGTEQLPSSFRTTWPRWMSPHSWS